MIAPPLSLAMDMPEWLTSMEAVLEVLNEGVVITNENHWILFANARFVEMTGIPRQDLIGFAPQTGLPTLAPGSHSIENALFHFTAR